MSTEKEIKDRCILDEAQEITSGARQADYGHPHENFTGQALIVRGLIYRRYGIDLPITPDFIGLLGVAIKLDREAGKPKRDNLVDIAGYAKTIQLVNERMKENERRSREISFGVDISIKPRTSKQSLRRAKKVKSRRN